MWACGRVRKGAVECWGLRAPYWQMATVSNKCVVVVVTAFAAMLKASAAQTDPKHTAHASLRFVSPSTVLYTDHRILEALFLSSRGLHCYRQNDTMLQRGSHNAVDS